VPPLFSVGKVLFFSLFFSERSKGAFPSAHWFFPGVLWAQFFFLFQGIRLFFFPPGRLGTAVRNLDPPTVERANPFPCECQSGLLFLPFFLKRKRLFTFPLREVVFLRVFALFSLRSRKVCPFPPPFPTLSFLQENPCEVGLSNDAALAAPFSFLFFFFSA